MKNPILQNCIHLLCILAMIGLLWNACGEKLPGRQHEKQDLNVVLILSDDQGAHLSVLGTKGIRTPHLDQFAKEGMLFSNAFAVVPSCAPSRSSIMTGMYPHANGHWRNTITPRLSEEDIEFTRESSTVDQVGIHDYIETLPELLREQGFFTAITQKHHMSPPWKFPYDARDPAQVDPADFKKAMEAFISQSGDRPFFIQANIASPHRNFNRYMEQFPQFKVHPDSIDIPAYLPDNALMREDVATYLGAVQLTDASAGAIMEVLREKGELGNTLIIFAGDQGPPYHRAKASPYYAGLHVPFVVKGPGVGEGKISDALISHIDIMPTVLEYLDLPIPETVQGKSLKPILSEKIEKIAGRRYLFGEHNSHGPIRAEHYPSRVIFDGRFYYIHNLMPEKGYELPADMREYEGWGNRSYEATLEAERSHPHLYKLLKQLEFGRPQEELYDTQNDPGQLVNLADQDKYQGILEELSNELAKWRMETGDIADDPLEIKTRQLQQ